MSKKDYTRYSTQSVKPERNQNSVQDVREFDEHGGQPIQEAIETVKSEPVRTKRIGVVANCTNLNVRKSPSKDSDVLCIIPCGTEVEISNDAGDFYHVVTTAGMEGFCMKDYIDVRK